MTQFNINDYRALPARIYTSQTGTNEVWRTIFKNSSKDQRTYLTLVFGDDIMFDMGWKKGDRLAMFQHRKNNKSFFLMKNEIGSKLSKNEGVNAHTARITKTIDLPLMKLGRCQSWEKMKIEELGKENILVITL